jgi:Glycosyl transferase 4-like domain
MTGMKRVLLVSLNFPPSTIASVHRARHLAKYLPKHGWETRVLTVDERFHKEPADPGLGSLVPHHVDVHRISAIPYGASRWLGIGDLALRAMLPLWRTLEKNQTEFQPNVIFMTGWPFYHMLLSPILHERHKVPIVLDFQDPWVSSEGAKRPKFSKGGMSHRLAVALEPRAIRGASWITSVSERQNEEMASRYPWLDPKRMSAIPIGGDPEDFENLRISPPKNTTVHLDSDYFNICYVGTFLPRSGEVVRTLFKAVARLQENHAKKIERLRLVFVGTSNQPAGAPVDHDSHRVMPIAIQQDVQNFVYEYPPRVPFLEALHLLANADAIVMLGSDEPHYTASKIYPGLMAERPWLSIFHGDSSAHQILSDAGGGVALAFNSDSSPDSLVGETADALMRLLHEPESLGSINKDAYSEFTADAVAAQFSKVFVAASE